MPVKIDFHVHLTDYADYTETALVWFAQRFPTLDEYRDFCRQYSDSGRFCELLQDNGVDYAVILAEVAPLTTGIATNEAVRRFCDGRPQLIPFCTFNPYQDARMADNLAKLHEQGFRGVKLYPTYNYFYPNDPIMYPLYAAAQQLELPVLFHTGSSIFANSRIKYGNPIFFDDIAIDFPRLKIVMAHGGRGAWYEEAMLMARLHQNVYVEVSGLPPHKLLEYFPEMDRFSHKFIFGSDWPGVIIKKNMDAIGSLPISVMSQNRILGENAARLLGIDLTDRQSPRG